MKNKKNGSGFMLAGAVLMIAALVLFIWNQYDADRAGNAAQEVMPQLVEYIDNKGSSLEDPYDPDMTVVEIDGYGYVGYLNIPDLQLSLPVMSECDDTRLKIAPCRYHGSVKTNNLVIAAHNYKKHFGRLSKLKKGAEVTFTDMDGIVRRYEVAVVDVLSPEAIDEMTAGQYDLSLFTCNYDGESRITVRCEAIAD